MPNPSTSSTTPENKAVMYVDRNEAGKIVGAWEDPQRDGQELVAIDDDGLQRFLAQPGGRYGATRWGQAKWF